MLRNSNAHTQVRVSVVQDPQSVMSDATQHPQIHGQVISGVLRSMLDVGTRGRYMNLTEAEMTVTYNHSNGDVVVRSSPMYVGQIPRIAGDFRRLLAGDHDLWWIRGTSGTTSEQVQDAVMDAINAYQSAADMFSGPDGTEFGGVAVIDGVTQIIQTGDISSATEGSFLHIANLFLDPQTHRSLSQRLGGDSGDQFCYGLIYANPQNPVQANATSFAGSRSHAKPVKVYLDSTELVSSSFAQGAASPKPYIQLRESASNVDTKAKVTHKGMVNAILAGKTELLDRIIKEYINTHHMRDNKLRNLEERDQVIDLFQMHMNDQAFGGRPYDVIPSIKADTSGIVVGVLPCTHDSTNGLVTVTGVIQLRPLNVKTNAPHPYAITAPAAARMTFEEFSDPSFVRTYVLDDDVLKRHNSKGVPYHKIITAYNVVMSPSVSLGGIGVKKGTPIPNEAEARARMLEAVYVQGMTNSKELTAMRIGLLGHDSWSGLALKPRMSNFSVSGDGGPRVIAEKVEVPYAFNTLDFHRREVKGKFKLWYTVDELTRREHQGMQPTLVSSVVHSSRNRLYHAALEFNDILEYYNSGATGKAVVDDYAASFIELVAHNVQTFQKLCMEAKTQKTARLVYTTSGGTSQILDTMYVYDGAAGVSAASNLKSDLCTAVLWYMTEQFRDSFITTEHRVIFGSNDRGVSAEKFMNIQLARMFLSLHCVKLNNDKSLTMFPKRYVTASLLPLSLSHKGYFVYKVASERDHTAPQVHLLSLFKEYFTRPHRDEAPILLSLRKAYTTRQWEAVRSLTGPEILGLVTASPIEVNIRSQSQMAQCSHVIDLGLGEYICLDPLIDQLLNDDTPLPPLKPGQVGFIYDCRYAILVHRAYDESKESMVYITTSTRSARIIPHTKNKTHNKVKIGDVDHYVGATAARLTGNLSAIKLAVEAGRLDQPG